ncbi:Protein of unknown function [Bacillus cytotoxicus]|uniref:Uncharacterized protein n=1 Tax=Bacillus cytotoxicus TaxID=580165 RepID=A0AAX2CJK5_9BACI|nr:Protein of unknown function [Bacillus cytotoxicus]
MSLTLHNGDLNKLARDRRFKRVLEVV